MYLRSLSLPAYMLLIGLWFDGDDVNDYFDLNLLIKFGLTIKYDASESVNR